MHKIFCDGSPEEICVLLDGEEHNQSHHIPHNRPLEIEYAALKYALSLLPIGSSGVIYTDNQIIVARFNSDHYSPREKDALHRDVLDIISKKKLCLIIKWVPRKQNEAGKMINKKPKSKHLQTPESERNHKIKAQHQT